MDQLADTVSRQPWLHELVIAVDGPATALSGPTGEFGGSGAEGFFVDDQRAVSVLTCSLGADRRTPVSASALGPEAEFFSAARSLGDAGADSTIEVEHHRTVQGPVLVERFIVHNRSAQALVCPMLIGCGGDGVDISWVKAGRGSPGPLPVSVHDGAVVWRNETHETRVTCEPAATVVRAAAGEGVVLEFDLSVPADSSTTVTVRCAARRLGRSLFDSDAAAARVAWSDTIAVQAADPRLARVVQASVLDLQHLLLADPEAPADFFAGAGTPWYLTLFGRDALWTARLALPLGTELAAGTLRALARRQGRRVDPATAEQPGKIPHEVRRSAAGGLPPLYYGTVDATALWILLLADARRWGLPEDRSHELLPALRAATGWLLEQADAHADGLIRYVDHTGAGLVNQGWKDSSDAIRFRDGTIAPAPIALVEVQAYAVEACHEAAGLLEALSPDDAQDGALARRAREAGQGWTTALRERFWTDGDHPYLGLAVDGRGRLVDAVASNMGHVLGTGALSASEAEQVAARLVSPNLLGRFGIRTYATDNAGFNPIGYHTGSVWTHDTAICALGLLKEGHPDAAASLAVRLVDAAAAFDFRSPELHGDSTPLGRPLPYPAACRPQAWAAASGVTLLQLALGLQVDVPQGRVVLDPPRSMPFGPLQVSGLQIAGRSVRIDVDGAGDVTVDGLPGGLLVSSAAGRAR